MSQPPNDQNPGYFTHLLQSNPQQYSSSPNQSNPSTPGSQHSNSSQPFPPYGTQMSPPEHAYQSQLAYHQNQQYGFQGYTNPRNTQPHFFPQQSSQPSFFSQQSSQPQCFPQHSSQPQFKIPQAQEPREPKRKQKRTGKQPVIELDKGDENEDMETRRLNIRWNNKEEILLAEAWIEHSQDNNIGKDQRDEIYWNKIIEDFHDRTTGPVRTKNMLTGKWTRMHGDCQRFNAYYKQANRKSGENEADLIETVKTVYLERVGKKFQYPHVWKILKEYPKWDAAEPIDGDNLQEVFGPDKRERPAGKQRAGKKQKSVETSGSTGGSQSESVSSLVSQDYRRKCDAAERAYEAQREKDLAIKKCEEMKFLMIDTSNLPPHKRAFIERQQSEIMRKYQDAGADDAGVDD
ncbi:hypothetical protein Tco_0217201 [Tanacetum coccineum]